MVLDDIMCACWNNCLLTVCSCNNVALDSDFHCAAAEFGKLCM